MKKTAALVLSVILLMSAFCINCFAADYSITLASDKKTVSVGDTVKISVDISDGLSGVNAYINYDTECFRLKEAKATDLMMTLDNTETAGEIHIASAAASSVKAGTLYNFELEVVKQGGEVSLKVVEALDDNDENKAVDVLFTVLKFSDSGEINKTETELSDSEKQEILNPTRNTSYTSKNTENFTNSNEEKTTVSENDKDSVKTVGASESTETNSEKETKTGIIAACSLGALSLAVVIALIIRKKSSSDAPEAKNEAENNDKKTPEEDEKSKK